MQTLLHSRAGTLRVFVTRQLHNVSQPELTLQDEYAVYTASTGSAGLELLEAHPVALVIVDQVMRGGLSGVDFLAKAIEIRPEAVRMMLTGYADEKAMMGAINDGHIYRFIPRNSRMRKNLRMGRTIMSLSNSREIGTSMRSTLARRRSSSVL